MGWGAQGRVLEWRVQVCSLSGVAVVLLLWPAALALALDPRPPLYTPEQTEPVVVAKHLARVVGILGGGGVGVATSGERLEGRYGRTGAARGGLGGVGSGTLSPT